MSTRYLLPCRCGKKIPVETTQAGQIITCTCGANIEVPTLLKLRSLETADEVSKAVSRGSWGLSQGLTMVSFVVALCAVAGLVIFYMFRPPPPKAVFNEKIVEQDISSLTLPQSEGVWQGLQQGIRVPQPVSPGYRAALKTYHIPKYATTGEAYRAAMDQYQIRIVVTLIILVLAAGSTIFGLVMIRAKKKRDPLAAELVDSSP